MNNVVAAVIRKNNNARIYYGSANEYFDYDQIIFATHADEALKLINEPNSNERQILSKFIYKKNIAYLHYDSNLMPKSKLAWSSRNSILNKHDLDKNCLTYWLNKLQNLNIPQKYFLTLNPIIEIDKKKIIKIVEFTHPFYDIKTIKAQKHLSDLQGINNTWFCGSYFGYGFHEDGLKSSINLANII